jgi:hypothetical protein
VSLGLWIAAIALSLALLAIVAAVSLRALAVVVVLAAASIGVAVVRAAETPFGIGDGVVPDVVGLDDCEAYTLLEKRDLRWITFGRLEERAPGDCDDDDGTFDTGSSSFDGVEIVAQRPAAGTDIGEDGVVRLIRRCEQERTCGRFGVD